MLKNLLNSFIDQGALGLGVIIIIIALAIYGVIKSLAIRNLYKSLNEQFERSSVYDIETGEKNLDGTVLGDIVTDFKKSASKGTDNINTEVLIIKHIKNCIKVDEKFINMIPAIAIALGLLGTFLGLTLAIHSTNGVLTSGVNSMEVFLNNMGVPLQGMASAFWTSIFGVLASVKMNIINSLSKREKELFFDTFEDYLDNTVYGENFYGFAKQFEKFNETLSDTMKDLTIEMRTLFREGVEELVDNINKNTLDMTETAKEMSNYTKDLNRVISSLDNTVDSFKEPVNKFKESIDEFKLNTDKLEFIMNESTDKLSDKIDVLGDTISKLESSIDSENNTIAKSVDVLLTIRDELYGSYDKLIESTGYIKEAIDSGGNKLEVQLSNLTEGYEGFENGLQGFMETIEVLKGAVSENVSKALKDEFVNLSDDIVDKLNESIVGIIDATNSLSTNTDTIAKLVKATNEWAYASK